MRKIVLQMMTTLDGRLDDPIAWVHGVSDDQYREIERIHAGFDTVLVGRTTYEEMAAYWPGALEEAAGTETNRRMAQRMRTYRKLVFSRSAEVKPTAWHNTELVAIDSDDELAKYLTDLKAQPGGDIHLAGGASFAQTVVGLDLVDEFQFFVYPAVSPGASWFSRLPAGRELKLLGANTFENGVVRLHYVPTTPARTTPPADFTDLLT